MRIGWGRHGGAVATKLHRPVKWLQCVQSSLAQQLTAYCKRSFEHGVTDRWDQLPLLAFACSVIHETNQRTLPITVEAFDRATLTLIGPWPAKGAI
jgi:hypothetical protein